MNNDKSISMVGELLKQRYFPEQYAQEQKEKEENLKETLAFIDGVLLANGYEPLKRSS